MSDDESWDFLHDLLEGSFAFEGSPKFTVTEKTQDPPRDATAEENASGGAEDKGQIPCEAPKESCKEVGRLGRGSFLGGNCSRNHISRILTGCRGSDAARDRAIKANQTRTRKHRFSGNSAR